jgi:hypothetical protein
MNEDIFLRERGRENEGRYQLPAGQGVKGPNFRVGFPSNQLLTRSLQSSQILATDDLLCCPTGAITYEHLWNGF